MGGPGSGSHYHWWRYGKKTVVERCRSLDANRWMREKILTAAAHLSGEWRWMNAGTGAETSAIGFEVCTTDQANPWLRLSYSFSGTGEAVDYRVRLATTYPTFGGLRWWFLCPLRRPDGQTCGRRVGKLYLPLGQRYFGCRQCHDLTYTSCQEHDARVGRLLRHPEMLEALLAGEPDVTLLGLAIKALTRRQRRYDRA